MRERMFRIVTGVCMVALMFILPMGRNLINMLILAVSLICIAFTVKISIQRKCINRGATLIAALLLLLFPLSFFSAGGFFSGMPEWFVLCFIYISITLEGRRKAAFFLFCMVETLFCYSKGQKKEIEELNKAENHFFSSMSHEIRTPINTIIGLNEIILRGDISEDVAENARNIQGASKMLLTLINDILDLSKIKSGKMDIVNVSYETGGFFSEIVNMIWMKAQQKGLEFRLHVDASIPGMLCGDEVRIKPDRYGV